jgi:hypothetical protein
LIPTRGPELFNYPHPLTFYTIRAAIDALLEPKVTEGMYEAGKLEIAECQKCGIKSIAAYSFKAMLKELTKEQP